LNAGITTINSINKPGGSTMKANSFKSKLFSYSAVIMLLMSISSLARPDENSALRVVPKGASICLRFSNPRSLEMKLSNLVDSLNIPDVPDANIGQLMGKMTGLGMQSLMDLEDAGFDMKGDVFVFWKGSSFDKIAVAVGVNSREKAEEAVRSKIGGAENQYKDMNYTVLDSSSAWTFLEDVFVYSKNKAVIIDAIDTHLKEKPSMLQDESYTRSIEALKEGDIAGYAALDGIVSAFLPILQSGAEKAKKEFSKQMSQQKSPLPGFNTAKIVEAEMDMGLWILQQVRSYSISMGIGKEGIWVNDSLKFKPDSPICGFLNIPPRKLELVRYLPGNILIAGGAAMDDVTVEKFNSVMYEMMMSAMKEEAAGKRMAELRKKYDDAVHEILSCLGDEVAFAIPAKSDRMMPRFVWVFQVVDEPKARRTIGNLDYILSISKPFYEAFGMDFSMTEGPTQRYNGIQIKSFQMDLSKMAESIPNAARMYPEKEFIWYAFVDGKMVYAMAQSADTIKGTIDAIKGREASISHSLSFEDINIRLPGKSNAAMYISPAGYLKFTLGMMMAQMGRSMPPDSVKPDIGFAVATSFDGDSIRNSTYLLVREIQELITTGMGFAQMAKAQR
jgi:hypothetical protein